MEYFTGESDVFIVELTLDGHFETHCQVTSMEMRRNLSMSMCLEVLIDKLELIVQELITRN